MKKKYLVICPEILCGNKIKINITGNPKGLLYLAKLLTDLANVDQEKVEYLSVGDREHSHLCPSYQLNEYSCEVEICRADAKGTGEYPKCFE
jgi:hypothetical protein